MEKDTKTFIVKITQPHAWYSNKVGQQTRVIIQNDKYVIEGNYYRGDHSMFIRIEDAEIMGVG